MIDKQWFIEAYDEIVADEAEGIGFSKARDQVAHAYANAVQSGDELADELSDVEIGRLLFDQNVRPERDHRKMSFRKHIEYLLAWLDDPESTIVRPPELDLAMPVGNGVDKILGKWTVDDWRTATTERYRNASDVTAAARDFDDQARLVMARLIESGAQFTEDLHP